MRNAFHFYNKKYFGNKLQEPKFSTSPPQGDWGHYWPQAFVKHGRVTEVNGPGTISLTNKWARTEKNVISTLIHEMIHMYIVTCLRIWPSNQHDSTFQKIADRINQDGWNISATNEITDTDIEDGDDSEEEYDKRIIKPSVFYVIEKPNGENYKFWGFKGSANDTTYTNLVRNIKKYGATKLFIYYCYSKNMLSMPEGGKLLKGVGGRTIDEMLLKLSKTIGEKITIQNFKLYKEVKL
jgi:hypothetical protein